METLDYITIIVFAIVVFIAGASFSSTGRDMRSFFAGNGNVPWWISGLSLFMAFFSAGTFVVWGSIAYSNGFVSITIQLTMSVAGLLAALFIAPRWNKIGCLTVGEYISSRFGSRVQKMYTYLFLFISIFTTGSFLYPIARIVETSAGIPLYASIIIIGMFCVLYVSIGGLRAVVVTDVLQFIILFSAVIIAIPLSLDKINGFSALIANSPPHFFDLASGEYSWLFIISFLFYNLAFIGGNWAYVQRYTSVKSPNDAKKSGLLFTCLYAISPFLWMLPAMAYRIFNNGLSGIESENAYFLMCKEVMPSGLLGLMLGGIMFAAASSLNASLNISAGVFTNDIMKRIRPTISEKHLMTIARVSTIGFGLLAIIVALIIPKLGGIVNVVISIAALTGVPMYLPVIWSLFSKNLNGKILIGTTLISLAINLAFKFVTPIFGFSLSKATEMLVGISVPAILLSINEIFHKIFILRPDQTPSYHNERIDAADSDELEINSLSLKIICFGAIFSGLAILALGLLADNNKIYPLAMGFFLLILGIILKTKLKYLKK